jgi:hypothetical protein
MRHKYVQTSAGLFHLHMAATKLVFKTHQGKPSCRRRWSLERWINVLGIDGDKLRSTLAQDHSACVDFLDTILDGCIFATLCGRILTDRPSTDEFARQIDGFSKEEIDRVLRGLQQGFSNFRTVSVMREEEAAQRNIDLENMLLFMQHALVLRGFHERATVVVFSTV